MRRARVLLPAILLLLTPAALGFEGRVVLPDGAPAADATVAILGAPGSSRTDASGRFVWRPDPVPPFRVLVVLADGRAAPVIVVDALPESGPLLVRVAPGLTEAVTVAAGVAPHIEAPPAAARMLVAREDLAQRRPQRLADVLENIPGAGRLDEGATVVPSLRGLARGRTLILLDGARVTAERRAGPSASYLDPEALESVEITRGPGSVAFGSDALGGVIDARTSSAPHDAPWSGQVDGAFGVGWPEAAARFEVQRGFGDGGILLSAHQRRLENFDDPTGEVPDSGAEDRGFLIRSTREVGPGLLSLGWQTDSATDVGKPSLDAPESSTIYPRETSNRLTAGWEIDPRGPFTEAGVEAFFGTYRLLLERERAASGATPGSIAASDVEARDYSLRAFGGRTLGRGVVRFGLDLHGRFDLAAEDRLTTLDAAGNPVARTETSTIEDAAANDLGLYAIVEHPLGSHLTGSVGLRGDRVETSNRGGSYGDRETEASDWAGHAALRVTLPHRIGLVLQAARGFRDPTLSDRYFVGASGRGIAVGNPDLESESSQQFDVAVTWEIGSWALAAYGYDYTIADLVERYEPSPGVFTFRNRGEARLRGIELEAHAATARGLRVDLAFSGAAGRADDDSPIADIPPLGGSLVVRQEIGTRGYVFARVAAAAQDDQPGPTEITTRGYATYDVGGGFEPIDAVELRLVVRNVSDEDYAASPDARAVLAPGRTAQLTVSCRF